MKAIVLPATTESIAQATAFIDAQLEALDCPVKAQMQIDVAVDEILGNVAFYAYGQHAGTVTVQFDFDEAAGMASVTFTDSGVPFDPLQKADPNVTAAAEEREAGGLGIYLVKKTMDQVEYRYENGQNMLTVRKRIR